MTQRPPKLRRRHSIGEWYGTAIEKLDPASWVAYGQRELQVEGLAGLPCPFQSNAICNKKGGVCSLRIYEQVGHAPVTLVGKPVTICPNRFYEENRLFTWIGETLLGTDRPVVIEQVGFLDRLRVQPDQTIEDNEDSRDFIGRIDSVLVHPDSIPLHWCAVELQAVYFSGKAMRSEFKQLAATHLPALAFPAAQRRPDWRSSGPKRLLPQLQTKVPTIRTWGRKMAVAIDEAFFASLVGLERERHLSNAEIVWFVVGYEPNERGWRLTPKDIVFTRLDASVKALTGGVPLPKERFEAQVVEKLRLQLPNHPAARS